MNRMGPALWAVLGSGFETNTSASNIIDRWTREACAIIVRHNNRNSTDLPMPELPARAYCAGMASSCYVLKAVDVEMLMLPGVLKEDLRDNLQRFICNVWPRSAYPTPRTLPAQPPPREVPRPNRAGSRPSSAQPQALPNGSSRFSRIASVNAVTDHKDKAHKAFPDWYTKLCFARYDPDADTATRGRTSGSRADPSGSRADPTWGRANANGAGQQRVLRRRDPRGHGSVKDARRDAWRDKDKEQLGTGLDVLAGLAESALSEENGGWDLTDPPPLDMEPQADEGRAPAPQSYSQPTPQGHAQTRPYNGASHDQPGQGQGRFPAQPPSHAQVHFAALGQLPLQAQQSGQVSTHGHQSQQPWGPQTQPQQRFEVARSDAQLASSAQCNEAQLPGQLQAQRPAASVAISDGIIRPQAVRSQGFTLHRGHQLGSAGQLQTLPALPSASLGQTAPQSMALGPSASQVSSPKSQQTPALGFQPVRPGPYNPKGSALGYLPAQSAESNGAQAPEALSGDGAPGQAATSPTKNGPQPSVPGHLLQQYPLLGALPKDLNWPPSNGFAAQLQSLRAAQSGPLAAAPAAAPGSGPNPAPASMSDVKQLQSFLTSHKPPNQPRAAGQGGQPACLPISWEDTRQAISQANAQGGAPAAKPTRQQGLFDGAAPATAGPNRTMQHGPARSEAAPNVTGLNATGLNGARWAGGCTGVTVSRHSEGQGQGQRAGQDKQQCSGQGQAPGQPLVHVQDYAPKETANQATMQPAVQSQHAQQAQQGASWYVEQLPGGQWVCVMQDGAKLTLEQLYYTLEHVGKSLPEDKYEALSMMIKQLTDCGEKYEARA
ncbi:MAG: hypothetical protein FRX49_11801 [Trebouxia sp. A1-2]|nr:MAG: hypothetical protein FRX49_11801 [Trebouxia sp. A1-2]